MAVTERLTVLVPFDLDSLIYPWGPELVCAAVSQNCPGAVAEVLDLRRLDFFQAAKQRFEREAEPALVELTRSLRNLGASWWDRSSFQPSSILASTLLLGEELLELPARLKLPTRLPRTDALRGALRAVRQQVVDGFSARFAAEHAQGVKLVWGVSPFDCFFSSLALSKFLKALFPSSATLWGGSRIELDDARKLVSDTDLVDGVVLGPGEKPIVNIFRRLRRGEELRTMKTDRLLNRAAAAVPAASEPAGPLVVEGEPFKLDFPGARWDAETNLLHVLEDVRCHWSECTFCREAEFFQRYEKDFYAPELDALLRSFADALEQVARAKRKRVRVSIDSDDPSTETIERIARFLVDEAPARLKDRMPVVVLWSYCRVSQMTEERFHRLAFIGQAKRLFVMLTIPIESMNPVALQRMIKGNTLLKNIKALKLAKDAGIGNAGAWYFAHYPGETFDSARIELDALTRMWHLIPRLTPVFMFASNGSPMGAQQEKYGIRIRPETPHPLTLHLFGAPVSSSSYKAYDLIPEDTGIRGRQQLSYFELIKEAFNLLYVKEMSPWQRTVSAARVLVPFLFWQGAGRSLLYIRRVRLLYQLAKGNHLKPMPEEPSTPNGPPHTRPEYRARFELVGSELIKEFPSDLPGGGASFRLTLQADEIEVLRFLYHYRKRTEITNAFAGSISAARLQQILTKHLQLESVFNYGNMYISLFNDPAFLDLEAQRQRPPAEAKVHKLTFLG
jgi:hypothetical protein